MNASEFNSFLREKRLTIVVAESVTAGLLASTIASVPGASSVLKGGVITYNEKLKTTLLNVSPKTLELYSAESIETTIEMVEGLSCLKLNSDIYVAVTGVASKSINDYQIVKPVGQVFVAVKFKEKLYSFDTILQSEKENSRNEIREKIVKFIFVKIISIIQSHTNY